MQGFGMQGFGMQGFGMTKRAKISTIKGVLLRIVSPRFGCSI